MNWVSKTAGKFVKHVWETPKEQQEAESLLGKVDEVGSDSDEGDTVLDIVSEESGDERYTKVKKDRNTVTQKHYTKQQLLETKYEAVLLMARLQGKSCNDCFLAAVESGSLFDVRLFLNNGAVIDAEKGEGQTALHIAVRRRHKKLITFLINGGVPLNKTEGFFSGTAYDIAVENGDMEIAALLHSKGALAGEPCCTIL